MCYYKTWNSEIHTERNRLALSLETTSCLPLAGPLSVQSFKIVSLVGKDDRLSRTAWIQAGPGGQTGELCLVSKSEEKKILINMPSITEMGQRSPEKLGRPERANNHSKQPENSQGPKSPRGCMASRKERTRRERGSNITDRWKKNVQPSLYIHTVILCLETFFFFLSPSITSSFTFWEGPR